MTSRRLLERDPSLLTEAEFMQHVRDVARLGRWLVYHTYRSKRSPSGFPDLVCVRGERVVFAELKRETGMPTVAQIEWLAALERVPGVETYLWRPSDMDEVVEVLTGKRQREAA